MEQLVSIEGLSKNFYGVQALDNVRFDLNAGEVHALMGENGAGKSTMMKILAGVYQKDTGTIRYRGEPVDIHDSRTAQRLGISIIHQELNLMNHLSAAQNIFIGREFKKFGGLVLDEKRQNDEAKKFFDLLKLDLDPSVKMGDLVVAKQQMVEIAKALSFKSRVLIMDEPTAALNDAEITELFKIIESLKRDGVGIVYISHRMDELKRIADRVTVMRDGRYVDTVQAADVTVDQVISMMVGRKLYEVVKGKRADAEAETVLEVRGLSRGKAIRDVSFTAKKGEILGFAGLMGAGRTEVARAIFGADPIDSGRIFVRGKEVRIRTPADAVRNGIGYLSEDRKRYGLAGGLSVETNIVMASMRRFVRALGVVNRKETKRESLAYVASLAIKTPGIGQFCKFLSGGNQQKVVIAKWLARDCEILIFDEPTRGIDIGAKYEIYKLLEALAESGKVIIMISSELPEVLRLSHRILVMCEGRLTGELPGEEATQEKIMKLATKRQ